MNAQGDASKTMRSQNQTKAAMLKHLSINLATERLKNVQGNKEVQENKTKAAFSSVKALYVDLQNEEKLKRIFFKNTHQK